MGPDQLDRSALLDLAGQMVVLDRQVQLESRVGAESKAFMDHKDLRATLDPPADRAQPATRDSRDPRVQQELSDQLAASGTRAEEESMVRVAPRVPRELRGQMAFKVKTDRSDHVLR